MTWNDRRAEGNSYTKEILLFHFYLDICSHHPHDGHSPVVASTGPSWVKQGQPNKRDCGSNGEGADEAHEEANESREAYKDL